MISIIVPSIRPEGLRKLVNTIDNSLCELFNLIVVSPFEIDVQKTSLMSSYTNIIDKGSPSRCLQRGISLVEDDIFTWGTDDGVYFPNKLQECVSLLRSKTEKDGIIVKYTEEGPGTFTGACDEYYVAKYHEANRQPGINPDWKTAPVGMFYTSYFKNIGGIDVRFEHINMNVHDYCYRSQNDGGILYYSDGIVMHCNSNNFGSDHAILDDAYLKNDLPLFVDLYKDTSRPIKIKFEWENSPEVWRRYASSSNG